MVQFRYAALCILTICDTCSVLYYNFKLGIFKMKSVLIKETMKEIERRDAAGRENERGQGSLKSQNVAQS